MGQAPQGTSTGVKGNKAKNRQHRAHAAGYAAYVSSDRYGINKARKLIRHLRRHPTCQHARQALKQIKLISLSKAKATFTGPLPQGV